MERREARQWEKLERVDVLQKETAGETYGDDLLGNKLGNLEDIAISRNTKQESNWVKDIGQDGLESEFGIVDVDVMTPPSEKSVDETDGGKNAEKRGDNGTTNLDTEPSTVGKSVQGVFSLVLIIVGNDDATSGEGLLGLGITQLGDGKGCRNRHDAGGNKSLGVQTKTNVANKHGTRNSSKTASQDLVKLGVGHVGDKGTDQHGRFSLSNEGGSSSDDGLGTGGVESPEDEDGYLLDEPLDESNIVQDLDERNEEDDGRNDAKEEPGELSDVFSGQESHTILGKAKQVTGTVSNELEDVVSDTSSQDEEANDVLAEHAADDSPPVDVLAAPAGDPETKQYDEHAEQADGTVGARVVGALLRDKGADQDGGDGHSSTGRGAQPGRDALVDDQGSARPNPLDGAGHIARGHVEEDEADGDGQPQQEGHLPVLIVTVQDQRGDPPAGEEQEDDEVHKGASHAVGDAKVPAALRAGLVRVDAGAHHVCLADLFVVAVVGRRVAVVRLVDAAGVVAMVLDGHERRVHVGAAGVDGIVVAGGIHAGRVVLVLVVMLVSRLQRRVRVVVDALGGVVVGSRSGG